MPLLARPALALGLTVLAAMNHRVPPVRPQLPQVTRVRVVKSAHVLELYAGETLLERDTVAIGPGGTGPKLQEGDRVTPVGHYHIAARHPSERFHIFLLVDYPNREDRARFAALKAHGDLPRDAHIGGNVGVHGGSQASWPDGKVQDWTAGCIAVDDATIERIAARVKDGTDLDIED
jgi:murein L,D-transpeptidase YafK